MTVEKWSTKWRFTFLLDKTQIVLFLLDNTKYNNVKYNDNVDKNLKE